MASIFETVTCVMASVSNILSGCPRECRSSGGGVARALFEALSGEAKRHDCARLDWAVLDWNDLAKNFYRKIGARELTNWEPWRLDGDGLEAMKREAEGKLRGSADRGTD